MNETNCKMHFCFSLSRSKHKRARIDGWHPRAATPSKNSNGTCACASTFFARRQHHSSFTIMSNYKLHVARATNSLDCAPKYPILWPRRIDIKYRKYTRIGHSERNRERKIIYRENRRKISEYCSTSGCRDRRQSAAHTAQNNHKYSANEVYSASMVHPRSAPRYRRVVRTRRIRFNTQKTMAGMRD